MLVFQHQQDVFLAAKNDLASSELGRYLRLNRWRFSNASYCPSNILEFFLLEIQSVEGGTSTLVTVFDVSVDFTSPM